MNRKSLNQWFDKHLHGDLSFRLFGALMTGMVLGIFAMQFICVAMGR